MMPPGCADPGRGRVGPGEEGEDDLRALLAGLGFMAISQGYYARNLSRIV
jgi:hypothetical protein